jgi:hypothetical protein
MVRLRAEITTNRVSVGSTGMEFYLLQRVPNGYGAHTDHSSRDTDDFCLAI